MGPWVQFDEKCLTLCVLVLLVMEEWDYDGATEGRADVNDGFTLK